MSYLAGIHDLAYCFQRLGGAGSSAYAGDWLGVGANVGAAAGKAMWYGRNQITVLKDALAKSGTKVLPTPTAIVDVAIVAISFVDLLNGFGPPDKGAAFTSGVDKFDSVYLHLDSAIPDTRDWAGDAAKAYADANAALKMLVQTMQELDKQMQALTANQGDEVQKAHNCIAVTLFGLVVAQGIALSLYLIPVVGPEVSCAWQIAAAFAAGATVFAFEMLTLANSMSLANEVNSTALKYADVAAAAVPTSTFARIEVAGAEETLSRITGFSAISDQMSAFSGPPTVASLVSLAPEGASEEQRALLSTLTSAGEPGTPGKTPTETTAPALADVAATSGQAAKSTAHVSEHMNLVNQTMGQVQQLATIGRQGQGAAAPAEETVAEETLVAANVEDAGAAAGAPGAERAPIDVAAAGPEAAPEPSPVERIK